MPSSGLKKQGFLAALLLVYLLTLSFRIYWLKEKGGFHWDETLSVVLACYNEYGWERNYPAGREMTGKEVKELALCDDASFESVFADLRSLRMDSRDPPQTNFYYSLLRLALAGLKTGDLGPIIFRAGVLNLLIFTGSFFAFAALLGLLLGGDRELILMGLCGAFLSTASISNTLFFRPYAPQEALFIFFAWFVLRFIDVEKTVGLDRNAAPPVLMAASTALVTALVLLSGYFSMLFAGMFGLYAMGHHIRRGTAGQIKAYFVILLFAFMLCQTFYANYPAGFLSYRAEETPATVWGGGWGGFVKNWRRSLEAVSGMVRDRYGGLPAAAALAALVLYRALFREGPLFSAPAAPAAAVFLIGAAYIVLVTWLAPYKILRYAMPAFPFLIILPALLAAPIRRIWVRRLFMGALCAAFAVNAFNVDKIENVYRGKMDEYRFRAEPSVPVMVLALGIHPLLIPYYHNEQIYVFNYTFRGMDDYNYDEFFILAPRASMDEILKELGRQALVRYASYFYAIAESYPDLGYNVDTGIYNFSCVKIRRTTREDPFKMALLEGRR